MASLVNFKRTVEEMVTTYFMEYFGIRGGLREAVQSLEKAVGLSDETADGPLPNRSQKH
jgi:hypothetical protein